MIHRFELPNARGWAITFWLFYFSLYLNSKNGVHGTLSIGIHSWEFSFGISQWDNKP